jgi:hypothetical protein
LQEGKLFYVSIFFQKKNYIHYKIKLMKNFITIAVVMIFLLITVNTAWSQNTKGTASPVAGPFVINFKTLADRELLNPPKLQPRDNEKKEDDLRGIPTNLPVPKDAKVFPVTDDFITGIESPQADSSPAPIQSFNGILDNGTTIPPDVGGAAGPSHLFETLNSQYRIFNKTGGTISTLSKSSFWAALSTFGSPYSDPHVVYDSASGRWYTCLIAQLTSGHYGIFLASSFTDDPTGSWYEYGIDAGPSIFLPDYPLLGYNSKWVVITTNDFKSSSFLRTRLIVYNKKKLNAGTLTSVTQFFDSTLFTLSPAETMDPLQKTEYLLTDYNGNPGDGNGYVQVCTITGTATSPVYTPGAIFGVNKPWAETSLDAPQKNSTHGINTGGTKMRAIIVRNGYIWATHTVYLPASTPTHSATDFWQIKANTNAIKQYGRIDDSTGVYWTSYPSLAVTSSNDVLIGSTLVGSPIFASAIYSYRNSSDAKAKFRAYYIYQPGLKAYFKDFGSGRNRWGDFSSTSIDPSNGTFWTLQEYAYTPANTWGTAWANVGAVAFAASSIAKTSSVKIPDNKALIVLPNPGKGRFIINYQTAKAGSAVMTVYNANGNTIYTGKVSVLSGINQFTLNLGDAGNGNYRVIIQNGIEMKQAQFIIAK